MMDIIDELLGATSWTRSEVSARAATEIQTLREKLRIAGERLSVAEEALEKLAKLGNGDRYGNSAGNTMAQEALAKIREE
jgi:hypothetical protein